MMDEKINHKQKSKGTNTPYIYNKLFRKLAFSAAAAVIVFALSACSVFSKNTGQQTVKETPKGQNQQITVIPQGDTTNEQDYQTIKPKTPSDTRGYINYGVGNRVDVNEIELRLQELSKSRFNPSRYYFEEGQYLSTSFIDSLLSRKSKSTPEGLNPPLGKGKTLGDQATNSPNYLSYILEQDYLTKSGNSYKLSGISLGIAVNSVYSESLYDQSNGMTYPVDVTLNPATSMAQAKADAVKIVQKVRAIKGLESVPIFVGLYMEAAPGSFTPGNYFAQANIGSGSSTVGNWTNVNEEVQLFPSAAVQSKYRSDSDKFTKFSDDIQSYFPNSIGVIGKGFYKDGNLTELTVNVNVRFYDETEIASFANYIAMLISNKFPFSSDIPVQVYVDSTQQPEAVIVDQPGMSQPFVHVYSMYQ